MKWELGRQGTGYRKLRLFQSVKLSCDAWLLHYPAGSHVPLHTDKIEGKRHFRLNVLLWGQDNFRGETLLSTPRIKLFRPDIMPHSVEPVHSGRLVLSIGWTR